MSSEYTHHVNREQVDRWRDTMLLSLPNETMLPADFLVVLAEVAAYGLVYLSSTNWASKELLFPWLNEMIGALLGIEGYQNENVTVGLHNAVVDPLLDAIEEIARSKWNEKSRSHTR